MTKNIQECNECLYNSSHPFGLGFNDEGICNGCLIHNEKFSIDWERRFTYLKKLTNKYKSKINYDCVVPINGNIETFHILDIIVNKLKLNPLGVNYNSGWSTEVGIKNLALIKNTFNLDVEQFNPNPFVLKEIIRNSISKFGSIYFPHLACKYSYPIQVAVEHKVPLIIWGAHEGVEQTGMFSHHDYIEMSYRHYLDFHCMGYKMDDFIGPFDTFTEKDLFRFIYPSHKKILTNKIKGIFLNNYTLWDPLKQNFKASKKYGAFVTKHIRSYDSYEYIDCHHYMGVHDHIKKKKYGYSKVLDQINREIRFKRIDKEKAAKIANYYSNRKDNDSQNLFLDWIGMSDDEFHFILNDNFKGKWDRGFWRKKLEKKFKMVDITNVGFKLNKSYFSRKGKKHIIFGKGV